MTRIKRRYIVGRVRGQPVGKRTAAAIQREIYRLLAEIYGDVGVGSVTGTLSVKWAGAGSSLFLLRTGSGGYRRVRTCLSLLSQLDGVRAAAEVRAVTGSLQKAVEQTARAVKTVTNMALQQEAASQGDKASLLAAMRSDLTSLQEVDRA
eukprot:TRINITY_DN74795_c0_g1_i1.p1 TRINITY_DN74795_c0_g1~~TRINITY_DN74795_c0_g1_i1.p1  ORF type:complete len:168 (+),score=14.07 TRINITY_DN74795_c0_g1_i1:57-506(+)